MAHRLKKCKYPLMRRVRGPQKEVVAVWKWDDNEERYPSYGEALSVFEVCILCGKRKRIKFQKERG